MKTYECVMTDGGMYARPITLEEAPALASNTGKARLVVSAPDSWQARQIAAGFNAASNAGTAAESYTVTMRGPGRSVPVIARAESAK